MKLIAKENLNLDYENYGEDFIKGHIYRKWEDDGYMETENGSSVCMNEEEIEKYFEIV